MASDTDIARLRRATNLTADDEIYTDELLSGMIDDLGFETAASTIWREKAATYSGLVDTTESGSSRRLSQLQEQALKMAAGLGGDDEVTTTGGSFTVEIERV
jgi:hypothetical protein